MKIVGYGFLLFSVVLASVCWASSDQTAICYIHDFIRFEGDSGARTYGEQTCHGQDNYGVPYCDDEYYWDRIWSHCYIGVAADYHEGIIQKFNYTCATAVPQSGWMRSKDKNTKPSIDSASWNDAHNGAKQFADSLVNSKVCGLVVDQTGK